MKYFFTLMTILLSLTAFCQTVILAETFPLNKFNSTGQGGQSGSFNGTFSAWSLKSSANSIVEVDDAPIGGTTMALRFATGGNGANSNPRVDTATSPNVDISSSASCSVGSMSFQFEWYTMQGESNDYEVKLQFSGDGGSTWNTVWTNNLLPSANAWSTVTVPGGIPNSNSYWNGADFKFRFAARRSNGSSQSDIRIDNIQVLATSSGPTVPSFSAVPLLVQGTDLEPGAVYLYQNVLTSPEILDALVKIEVDSNAHVTYLDNNSPNASRFQPRIANDGLLGNGAETLDRGWVQFSITFIKDDSYQENDPLTDADDSYTTQSLNGLRYQHYDVDGFENGSGSGAGYFREMGCISSPAGMYLNTPSHLTDCGNYNAAACTWRKILGEMGEHNGISSDPDVVFTASFNAVSVVRFRLGFEFSKGNGSTIVTEEREYGTEFTCLSYVQQASLPVSLISFNGSYRSQATTLNWETENEQNFDHFEIQRSNNAVDFTSIGSKTASNSPGRLSYLYADDLTSVNGNVFYYRLKMIDQDGKFKYSNVIMIRKESRTINGIALNPTPVTGGMATVRLTSSTNGPVSFKIMDLNGRLVLQQQNKVYEGNNSISINNLDRLQAGIYVLQMANGDETTTIKFSIAK